MQYYVIGPDGNKYGPADVPTLKQWVAENRLQPDSMLEDFGSGQRVTAASVPGLFEDLAPAPPVGMRPEQSMYQNPPQPMASYQRSGDDGSRELTKSFIYLALAFFCCFPIFSPLGIVQANAALAKGNPSAGIARTLHFVVLGLGVVSIIFYIVAFITGMASGRPPGTL